MILMRNVKIMIVMSKKIVMNKLIVARRRRMHSSCKKTMRRFLMSSFSNSEEHTWLLSLSRPFFEQSNVNGERWTSIASTNFILLFILCIMRYFFVVTVCI